MAKMNDLLIKREETTGKRIFGWEHISRRDLEIDILYCCSQSGKKVCNRFEDFSILYCVIWFIGISWFPNCFIEKPKSFGIVVNLYQFSIFSEVFNGFWTFKTFNHLFFSMSEMFRKGKQSCIR
jgi:hypothetical protein